MNNLLFRVAAFGMLFVAVSASAQETDEVRELQRVNDAQQQQLEAQQLQIETLMQMLEQLQSEVEPLVTSADKEQATPGEEGAPAEPSSASALAGVPPKPASKIGLSQVDRFDPDTPTASDVTFISPTAMIQVPGTGTSVGVHGMLQFQIAHDTSGPDSNQWNTASIPVDGAPPETKFNINPSRFVISSATEYPGNSQLNTLLSVDFNGQETVPEPRLRLAWAEYVNEDLGIGVIGGQAFPTLVDLRAVPEMLDFAIPVGALAQRQGLLRLTKSLSETFLMEASIETPQNVRYIDADKRTRLPDGALAGTWLVNGDYLSHFKLGVQARDLRAVSENGTTDSALGWTVAASGKVNLPFLGDRTNFKLTVHTGDGFGTQLKGGPEEGVFDTSLELIGTTATFGGLQHFWSDRFRSNLTFGYLKADNPATAPGDALDSSTYASVNFVWVPGPRLTLGVEYLYGERVEFDGTSGTSNRILFSSKLDY
jgi:hypothetical protein